MVNKKFPFTDHQLQVKSKTVHCSFLPLVHPVQWETTLVTGEVPNATGEGKAWKEGEHSVTETRCALDWLSYPLVIFFFSTRVWTQGLHLEPLHQSFFVCDRVLQTICWGCLWTAILLISASWVARISGMSHWYLAPLVILRTLHLSSKKPLNSLSYM
jgi:hypothetical protein